MRIPPDHPFICYTGHKGMGEGLPRPVAGSPYSTDTPGGRITFACDAGELDILLEFADKAALPGHEAYSSQGTVLVDGRQEAVFTRQSDAGGRQTVHLSLSGCRRCEIVLPVADTVSFSGLEADGPVSLISINKDSKPVYVGYGDSVTQGFYAGDARHSFPSLLGVLRGWEVINMGFGGRGATPADAEAVVAQNPDIVSVLMGVNDCLQQVPPGQFRQNYSTLLSDIRQSCPHIPILALTPLCVPPQPGAGASDFRVFIREHVEDYRQIIREVVAAMNDAHLLLIEGPRLIPEDQAYFADRLHPNDAGFKIMAERLSVILTEAGI